MMLDNSWTKDNGREHASGVRTRVSCLRRLLRVREIQIAKEQELERGRADILFEWPTDAMIHDWPKNSIFPRCERS